MCDRNGGQRKEARDKYPGICWNNLTLGAVEVGPFSLGGFSRTGDATWVDAVDQECSWTSDGYGKVDRVAAPGGVLRAIMLRHVLPRLGKVEEVVDGTD